MDITVWLESCPQVAFVFLGAPAVPSLSLFLSLGLSGSQSDPYPVYLFQPLGLPLPPLLRRPSMTVNAASADQPPTLLSLSYQGQTFFFAATVCRSLTVLGRGNTA